ncbi:glutamate--cysteine ligase [Mangrovitalea sediminis]|uniref:glutamate--cysteine ligase n=1 Tax=Mangrovitalea sediminis TaxID=1982043 RepID=UPI000BE5FA50|nr:glutamate--cysteine ligase [Mangrovitalea sediminis]
MSDQRRQWFEQLAGSHWDGFRKGVEKEGLRVDTNGFIAQTPHPESLGSTLTHPQITTDYSESLLELITPVCSTTEELLQCLTDIHTFVQMNLGDEVLWAASMPCRLDGDASIPIADYGTSNIGRLKHVYRQGLAVRYGRVMQSIAGAHYNFSLPETFWNGWQETHKDIRETQEFKSEQYFWMIRNFRRRSWLLMYLFGSSPALDASFVAGRKHHLMHWDDQTWFGPSATSLRMGDLGYHNNAQSSLDICFNRLDNYIRTLDRAIHTPWPEYEHIGLQRDGEFIQINTNVLQIENEYYSPVRPKRTTRVGEKPVHALRSRGVEYIEVRCLDLDPFDAVGVNAAQIDFLDLFLLDCLMHDSPVIDDEECYHVDLNYKDVVARGRDPRITLYTPDGAVRLQDLGMQLLDGMESLAETLDGQDGGRRYRDALGVQRAKLSDISHTPAARVLAEMRQAGQGHVDWTLSLSAEHQRRLREQGLAADTLKRFEQSARQSIADQKAMEAADTQEFSEFLARYQMI